MLGLIDIQKYIYTNVGSYIWATLQAAYNYERFGNSKAENKYKIIADFYILFITISLIREEEIKYREQTLSAEGCEKSLGYEYYYEKYNLACIVKHFKCKMINLEKIIEDAIKNLILSEDGIGGMYIETLPETDCNTPNYFRIS